MNRKDVPIDSNILSQRVLCLYNDFDKRAPEMNDNLYKVWYYLQFQTFTGDFGTYPLGVSWGLQYFQSNLPNFCFHSQL
jgi:hypothetical protein